MQCVDLPKIWTLDAQIAPQDLWLHYVHRLYYEAGCLDRVNHVRCEHNFILHTDWLCFDVFVVFLHFFVSFVFIFGGPQSVDNYWVLLQLARSSLFLARLRPSFCPGTVCLYLSSAEVWLPTFGGFLLFLCLFDMVGGATLCFPFRVGCICWNMEVYSFLSDLVFTSSNVYMFFFMVFFLAFGFFSASFTKENGINITLLCYIISSVLFVRFLSSSVSINSYDSLHSLTFKLKVQAVPPAFQQWLDGCPWHFMKAVIILTEVALMMLTLL